ncbi:MAG: gephyrin-like molybdotransferase Glp [Pseudomonadota bacterium]
MTKLLSLDAARALLLEGVAPTSTERIELADLAGRVLAECVSAARAQPPTALSAMDGYAVRSEDVARDGARLTLVGEAPAGGAHCGELGAGQAVRIFTGAPIPDGADRVVIQENVDAQGDEIVIPAAQTGETFIRPEGLDFAATTVLLGPGQLLTPARIALLAAANRADAAVFRKPRIAIVASGDELVEPGGPLSPVSIVNSAAYGVAALCESLGADANVETILPDDLTESADLLEAIAGNDPDIIVTIGGASVGARDLLKPAFEAIGGRIVFQGVAVRPGKPVWHGRLDGGPLLLGLPGNPASALACAHLFLAPLIGVSLGCDAESCVQLQTARLFTPLEANGGRETYLRGYVTSDPSGGRVAHVDQRQDSSLLTPFAAANALVRRSPKAPPARPGDVVDVLVLNSSAPA